MSHKRGRKPRIKPKSTLIQVEVPTEFLEAFDLWWPRKYLSRSSAVREGMEKIMEPVAPIVTQPQIPATVALAQPEHVCEWHIDPPCGQPGRVRVNFEDGPVNVCATGAEEIKRSYPDAISNEVDLRW